MQWPFTDLRAPHPNSTSTFLRNDATQFETAVLSRQSVQMNKLLLPNRTRPHSAFLQPIQIPNPRIQRTIAPRCCIDRPSEPAPPQHPRPVRLSLPTFRERRYLEENCVERTKGKPLAFARATAFSLRVFPLIVRPRPPGEKRYPRMHTNASAVLESDISTTDSRPSFSSPSSEIDLRGTYVESDADISESETPFEDSDDDLNETIPFEIPPWAYIVRVRASKASIGKRAVQRNRAKRRLRAAASVILPPNACRGLEYVFTVTPEVLTIEFADLLLEMETALRNVSCWRDNLTLDMLRRERYCKR